MIIEIHSLPLWLFQPVFVASFDEVVDVEGDRFFHLGPIFMIPAQALVLHLALRL